LLRRVETALAIGGQPLYGLSQVVVAMLMLAVMLFRPQGLMGQREIGDVIALLLRRDRPTQPVAPVGEARRTA
jgi:hypothetical protein